MREIKFRAWDKKHKKMADFLIDPQLMFGEGGSLAEVGVGRSDDYILMQFTGLYDKHGTEIYEGDILAKKGQVIWRVTGFDALWTMPRRPEGHETIGNRFALIHEKDEIIGNVYQNPELLEGALSKHS